MKVKLGEWEGEGEMVVDVEPNTVPTGTIKTLSEARASDQRSKTLIPHSRIGFPMSEA